MTRNDYDQITYEARDGVALLTIERREKLNSLTPEAFSGLHRALADAAADRGIRAVILTGGGTRAFCAGFDVLHAEDLSISDARLLHSTNLELNKQLLRMEAVTISAVNGMALGAGFEISMLCDLTIAAQSATFGMPESAIGVYPGGLTPLLCHMIGMKRAKELLFLSKTIDAHEARAMGIVNEVVEDATLMVRAFEVARRVLEMAPLPLAMLKARMQSLSRVIVEDEISHFVEAQTLVFSSSDFKEGMKALKEKRKPVFRGK